MLAVGVVLGVVLESVVVLLPEVLPEGLLVAGPDTVADVVVGPLAEAPADLGLVTGLLPEAPADVELVAWPLALVDDEELLALPADVVPLEVPNIELFVAVAV